MHWPSGLHGRLDHSTLAREQRHEPFTPRIPRCVTAHTTLSGAILAAGGLSGNWLIGSRMTGWPAWMLFPSMILAVLALVAMVVGLGILVVRALEPVIAVMDLDWDADPLAALAIPLSLQRKCEQLGFWTTEELVRAIDGRRFPWTSLEYDERMQLERAAQRWRASTTRQPEPTDRARGKRRSSRERESVLD